MKYKVKYLINLDTSAEFAPYYNTNIYKLDDEINSNGEMEIEIKSRDYCLFERYGCINVMKGNKIYSAMSDEDFIKFKENVKKSYEYYYMGGKIKLVKDLIIEEILE